jgi:methyl-accepting chemotaxis protein
MNKMAEVVGLFENGTAKVKFDGEEVPSEKEYGFLRHYIPKVGDKVFMMEFNGSYIIFDAVDYQVPAQKPINLNYIKGNTTIEGDLTLKGGPTTVEAVNGKFTNIKSEKIEAKNIEEKFRDYKEIIDTNKKTIEDVKAATTKAQNTADNAQSTANSAQSTANSAQSTANSAQSTANSAQSTANSARSTAAQLQGSISSINMQISNINTQIAMLRARIR